MEATWRSRPLQNATRPSLHPPSLTAPGTTPRIMFRCYIATRAIDGEADGRAGVVATGLSGADRAGEPPGRGLARFEAPRRALFAAVRLYPAAPRSGAGRIGADQRQD